MSNPLNVYLFDLDGVLITPGGYNAALRATVDHFTVAMGLGPSGLDDSAIETFAVQGIGLEWDSSAICLGAILLELWKTERDMEFGGDVAHMLSAIAARNLALPAIDYRQLALKVARATPPGGQPAEMALRLLSAEAAVVGRGGQLREIENALRLLLGGTREPRSSPTMRIFQHYTLGSPLYVEVYGIAAQFETDSLLRRFDRPTLSAKTRRDLASAMQREGHRGAAYTLRLSRPPGLATDGIEFAPEAEIGLEAADALWLPLVGYGEMRWLAARYGAAPDAFVKPSPVHGLAALGRAVGGGEREALEAAYALWALGEVGGVLGGLSTRPLILHVFEDSASSARGVCEAVKLLRAKGIQTECRPYGIASSPERELALRESGIVVFDHLELALHAAGL